MRNINIPERINREIILSNIDTRYSLASYLFVLRGLDFNSIKTGEKRHFSGRELIIALVEFADRQFGSLTQMVFRRWGIFETRDFGFIIYNLIKIGLLGKNNSDSVEDFFDIIKFSDYFANQSYYQITPEIRSRILR